MKQLLQYDKQVAYVEYLGHIGRVFEIVGKSQPKNTPDNAEKNNTSLSTSHTLYILQPKPSLTQYSRTFDNLKPSLSCAQSL